MGEMSFQFLFQDSFLLFSVVEIASHYSFTTVLAIAETYFPDKILMMTALLIITHTTH